MSFMKKIYESVTGSLMAVAISAAVLTGTACAEEITVTGGVQTLWAGQNIDAGTVTVTAEGDNLVVTYETSGGWTMDELHLWAGYDLTSMPTTRKGNPIPGQFPYVSENIAGKTAYSFTIGLSELGVDCGESVYLAAHAALSLLDENGDVVQTETGWGDGTNILSKGNWATYFIVLLTCDDGPVDQDVECETAFAYYEPSFLTLDEAFGIVAPGDNSPGRWGWTNGPLTGTSENPADYTMKLIAGAGGNDVTKGVEVGTVTVSYDGSTVVVKYELYNDFQVKFETNSDGIDMDDIHLYVGTAKLPSNKQGYTVAPGQYPFTPERKSDVAGRTYYEMTIDGFEGDPIYVVAHATVCAFTSVWGD